MKKKWFKYLEDSARQIRKYHRNRAKNHPEEYPDYKRKEC